MTRGYSVKCLPVPCHIEIFTASLFTPAVLLILILTSHFKNVTDSYIVYLFPNFIFKISLQFFDLLS